MVQPRKIKLKLKKGLWGTGKLSYISRVWVSIHVTRVWGNDLSLVLLLSLLLRALEGVKNDQRKA